MSLSPPESKALDAVVEAAREAGVRGAWLVGGAVRDRLFSGAWGPTPDLDVVFEGDARAVARRLAGEIVEHEAFGTATWTTDEGHVDLVTARSESYVEPGALPTVVFADLDADLRRRDFTVNAIALELWPTRGELVDPLGGAGDLSARRLRALHPGSFADDPTRLLRAARYAVRLGLEVEETTRGWFAAARIEDVSGERWLAEWRQLLAEPDPSAVLAWLGEHGLAEPLGLDVAASVVRFDMDEGWLGSLAVAAAHDEPLNLPVSLQDRMRALRAPPPALDLDDLALEQAVGPMSALRRGVLAARFPTAADRLERGAALAAEAPLLRGADLLATGMSPGPAIGEALRRVRRARRLEGITTAEQALALLRAEGTLSGP